MLAWLCNRVMAVSSLDARAIVRASSCISTQWRAHPRGDHCTMSCPWHANIMNGLANEGLLIDYGENRVLLTQWWQLQGVPRHFVNALFFQPVQPRGSLYRPSDQCGHLAWDEVYYLYNILLSSYMFYNTNHCIIFLFMHPLTLIQQINVLYISLQAYTKANQVCPPVMRVNGGFRGFTLWAVVQWSRQKLLRWEVYVEGHCLWLTN